MNTTGLRSMFSHLPPSPKDVREDHALLTIVGAGAPVMELDPLVVLMARLDSERDGA